MTDFPDMPDVTEGVDLGEIGKYLQAELRQIQENPLKHSYPPHEGQEKILGSSSRRRIVIAANRVGKTDCGMRDAIWCARGEHPYRKVRLHTQIWIGSPDYPSYLKFHKPAFDRWCPPSWIVGEFNSTEKWVRIRRVDGGICTIFFMSYDSDRTKWQGAGVDGIWLDEECPEPIFKECLARIVTTRGWIMLTFTPVSGIGWWHDAIWLPATKGANRWWSFQMALATHDEANEAEYNVGTSLVPHLTREQIIEFASDYPDPDDRAVRIFGEVRGRTGLVYKGYRGHIHKVPRFRLPKDYELWGAVDPGYHGFHVTIGAISPGDRMYIVQEMFSQQEATSTRFKKLAEKVRALRTPEDWGPQPPVIVCFVDTEDPQVVLELNIQAAIASEEDAQEGKASITLAFASLDQGLKARKAGFLRVQQALQPRPERKTPLRPQEPGVVTSPQRIRPRPVEGEPVLYFFDDLKCEWQGEDSYHRESRLLWEIDRYSWKEPPRDSTVRPDDGDDRTAAGAHAMASLRYLVMARLGAPDDIGEKKKSERHKVSHDVLSDFEETEAMLLEQMGLI